MKTVGKSLKSPWILHNLAFMNPELVFSASNFVIFIIAGSLTSNTGQVYIDKSCRYECRFCCKAFQHLGHLKRHERIHSDEKPFKCDYCDKGFKDKSILTRHRTQHTGEKKVSCPNCGKTFTRSFSLKVHLRVSCV